MAAQLPHAYLERLRAQPGFDTESYLEAQQKPAATSIRVNPAKINDIHGYEPVSWSKHGYYLPQRPFFTFDPLFHAGAYYVQEASSMFLEFALSHIDLDKKLRVLDLCAAPGGKSTHLLSLISKDSLLVSNEVIKSRARILYENLVKWGNSNLIITSNDPKDFSAIQEYFDLLVIDAPCSGEGLFRKDAEAVNEWSEDNVKLCSLRQQRILGDIVNCLKPGGHLLYSTCTHAFEENENNLQWLCNNFGLESIRLQNLPDAGIEETETNGIFGYRFYPHKVKGEGFFCGLLRKKGSEAGTQPKAPKKNAYTPVKKPNPLFLDVIKDAGQFDFFEFDYGTRFFNKEFTADLNFLAQHLNIVSFGTEAGQLIKTELHPAQALACSLDLQRGIFPEIEVSHREAVNFLRKESIADPSGERGWKLVTFKNTPIGFLKNIGNRTNNYYPKEWRILKQPDKELFFSLV